MTKSLFFYDLETSGFNPREARIMQFAGQRTTLGLNPLGNPVNHLIKMSDDTLPSPEAILLTGITPQRTIEEGLVEAEFLKKFYLEAATPDTVFVGYNNVRFDDEFMRYINYRNYYDPYEWHWNNGRSRWDLLDVVRMTRALRPDGINWPKERDGKSTNRLESLSKANKIKHDGAHEALSDVLALIDLAKLVRANQPKLFDFLFEIMRDKARIDELVNSGDPFVYTSGKYPSEFEKTTLVSSIVKHPKRQGNIVFDLRYDPDDYLNLSIDELIKLWRPESRDDPRLPVKTLQFNRLPAIAPLSVLDENSQKRLDLDIAKIMLFYQKFSAAKADFSKKILSALSQLDAKQEATNKRTGIEVDERLYEEFLSPKDKEIIKKVVASKPEQLQNATFKFADERLNLLLPLYKARNYPQTLSAQEVEEWEQFKRRKLFGGKENSRASHYFQQLSELGKNPKINSHQAYILEELKLFGESILPTDI